MSGFKPQMRHTTKEKTVITIRLDDDKLEMIDRISGKLNSSRNEFLVDCINFALDNLELPKDLD